jgi:purine-binding chemotaxis protein CheW
MDSTQYLTFSIGSDIFAVEVLKISEIIPIGTITPIPQMQPYIQGVMNIRGNIVPIVNLNDRLNLSNKCESKRQSIVIVKMQYEEEESHIGFIVSKVDKVFSKQEHELESIVKFDSKVKNMFVKNVAKVNEQFITILNMDTILNLDDLSATMQE